MLINTPWEFSLLLFSKFRESCFFTKWTLIQGMFATFPVFYVKFVTVTL